MFRFLDISLNGAQASLPFDSLTYFLSFAIFVGFLKKELQNVSISKILILTLLPSVGALLGGSLLYHGIIDHNLSFQGEGQAYYGALFFQTVIFYFLTRTILKQPKERSQAMDVFSVASLFIYSILRIGCFANGCCYGKLCRYPWAVIFRDQRSLTPLLGLPLHPTQLYAAFHGFFAGFIMILLYRKRKVLQLEGRMYGLFIMFLGFGRIIIEPFRADIKRSLLWGIGVNQWISFLLVLIGICFFMKSRTQKLTPGTPSTLRSVLPLFIVSLNFLFAGCGLALKPPGKHVVSDTQTLSPGIYAHRMVDKRKQIPKKLRNLLFIAVDDLPEDLKMFQSGLKKIYKTETTPRMEEVLWWHYSSQFSHLYQEVVRIQYDSLDWVAFREALNHLEAAQVPYDIFLLTHGIPNYIVSSKKHVPIGWKDFQEISGENRLHFLDTVFLQSCFGNTLAQDFKNIGANSVISFQGIHDNILFFDIFLKEYFQKNGSARSAFEEATFSFDHRITHDLLYRYVIEKLLNFDPQEYAEQIRGYRWMPSLLDS